MPLTKSAKKSLRQSEKRRKINKIKKEQLRIAEKKLKRLISNKNFEEAKKQLSAFYKLVDKIKKSKIIKKNKARRKKSRIASLLVKTLRTAV